ncbi:hypothetical protein ABEB36_014237 [Hypothenemus hampei]|uniref:Uncharacterized protein n=1 Tax=Hypothenemus hampei TaxID=57062 RepID=A0ABD1E4L8_HYPHA
MSRYCQSNDIYWSSTESDSDESYRNGPYESKAKQPYVDPWDLENYAYIREHLDSMDLNSNPGPTTKPTEDFAFETNSNSFFYVPGTGRLSDIKHTNDVYADIEDVRQGWRAPGRRHRRQSNSYYYEDENIYDLNENSSVFGIYDHAGRFRKVSIPVDSIYKSHLDQSLESSGSYGDDEYNSYGIQRQEIYSKLEEEPLYGRRKDTTMPIYDDVKRLRKNFGLTNYGHLKIDYSWNWNNLNNYIRYQNREF